MSRGTLCLLLGVALIWVGWRVGTDATRDVAILTVSDVENVDRYVSLWAVEDADSIWLRAARPDSEWLDWLGERPNVRLELDGESHRYTAEIFRRADVSERIDELMREKYRWADRARELLLGSDTVPVRLDPQE